MRTEAGRHRALAGRRPLRGQRDLGRRPGHPLCGPLLQGRGHTRGADQAPDQGMRKKKDEEVE